MKLLENIKRTLESIEGMRAPKVEEDAQIAKLLEKYKDIPAETLKAIVADVKADCAAHVEKAEEQPMDETEQKTDVIDVTKVEPKDIEHTDANKAESTQMTELDASEEDNTEEDFYTEEDDDTDDELIISEEGDTDDELIISEEDNIEDAEEPEQVEEDDDEDDVYVDELDIATADKEPEQVDENAEKIDMTIPGDDDGVKAADKAITENAEKIDMNIPEEDVPSDAADAAAKEHIKEDNTGAKAAMANKDNKGAFSSDVDALTEYLDKY